VGVPDAAHRWQMLSGIQDPHWKQARPRFHADQHASPVSQNKKNCRFARTPAESKRWIAATAFCSERGGAIP
jgi:hypothetical protein